MTKEEAQQAWEKMRSEICETNWLFVGTINPQMVDAAIEALSSDTVSREVYDKRTQADENIIDSYRQEFQKALSAERTGEWIPVSERLPEKDELVLVTVWNDVNIAWRNRYGGWESAEDMYGKGNVTAWMPLPEPYREDGEA